MPFYFLLLLLPLSVKMKEHSHCKKAGDVDPSSYRQLGITALISVATDVLFYALSLC